MTPKQISDKASDLRKDLVALSGIKIGIGNATDMMRKYQVLISDLIVLVRELADSVDTALIPRSDDLPIK